MKQSFLSFLLFLLGGLSVLHAQDVVIDARDLGPQVASEMFGANIVYTWSDFDQLDIVENSTNLYAVRFPGGSVTENELNLVNPNQYLNHNSSGTVPANKSIQRFIQEVNQNNWKAVFVVPTKRYVNRETIGYQEVKQYVKDILSGTYGTIESGRTIHFEVGNEFFWGADKITGTEYGKVAIFLVKAIRDAINESSSNYQTEISVQSGVTDDQAKDVAIEFKNKSERNHIDYLTWHWYPGRTEIQLGMWNFYGKNVPLSERMEDIRTQWNTNSGVNVPFFMSEYNIRNANNSNFDHGLKNPMGIMSIFAEATRANTTMSTIWPVVAAKSLRTRLYNWNVSANFNGVHNEWMQETIKGKQIVNGIDNNTFTNVSDFRTQGAYVQAFVNDQELVIFVYGTEHEKKQFRIDVKGFKINKRRKCRMLYTNAGREGDHLAPVKTRRIWPKIWGGGSKLTFTLNKDSRYEVACIILKGTFSGGGKKAGNANSISSNQNIVEIAQSDFDMVQVKTYPNPASDILNVHSNTPLKQLFIFDALGKLVKEVRSASFNYKQLPIHDLHSGLYYIRYVTVADEKGTLSFIKE